MPAVCLVPVPPATAGSVSVVPDPDEYAPRLGGPRVSACTPLRREPFAQLLVALGGVEDPPYDELRRDGAVPAVLLQPERDVVAPRAAEAVELAAEPERDRRPGVAAALPHAEAQMLALADRAELAQLASVDEQHHAGIPEPERREARQLLAERQAQLAAGDDRVDDDARPQVVFGEYGIGVRGERRSER